MDIHNTFIQQVTDLWWQSYRLIGEVRSGKVPAQADIREITSSRLTPYIPSSPHHMYIVSITWIVNALLLLTGYRYICTVRSITMIQ